MKEIRLNGYFLEMYDSIDELPEERYQKFNLYATIDAGVGSDIDSVARHCQMILQYNEHGKKEQVAAVATNLMQCLTFVLQEISPRMMCFSVMVKTVNGKPWDGLSPEGAKKLTSMLSEARLTAGKVRGFLAYAKKKLKPNWSTSSRVAQEGRRQKNTTLT